MGYVFKSHLETLRGIEGHLHWTTIGHSSLEAVQKIRTTPTVYFSTNLEVKLLEGSVF